MTSGLNRRGFLGAMLAACAAPAYVKAGVLMPVREIIVPAPPEIWRTTDGIHPSLFVESIAFIEAWNMASVTGSPFVGSVRR